MNNGWIGVDLDGTLAECHGWSEEIGPPVPKMLERVKRWLADGKEVRILTARADPDRDNYLEQTGKIVRWCLKHVGQELETTNTKDFRMVELWDDRAVQVIPNTGERADGRP